MYYVCDKCGEERPNVIADSTCIKGGYCHWVWILKTLFLDQQSAAINYIVANCHGRSVDAGWYRSPETGLPLQRNIPEMLCLIHSEISEALEGYRKGLMDDKLPHRKMIEVELADALIRIADLAGYLNLDLGGAYVEKLLYNETRSDHKPENRALDGGKKF